MAFHIMHLPRSTKVAFFMAYDVTAACVALWLALVLRLGFSSPYEFGATELVITAAVMLITVASFYWLGLYKSIVRFMGHQAIIAIIKGVSISTLSLAFLVFMTQTFMPRSTPLIYWCLAMLFVGAPRLFIRLSHYRQVQANSESVAIYGAGSAGRQLLTSLRHGEQYSPVLFIDDDETLHGGVINGIRVVGLNQLKDYIDSYDIKQVFLAIASLGATRRREVIESLMSLPVYVKTIPSFEELVHGKVSIAEIQEITLEEILGREPVPPQPELLEECIADKVVLVTGAGGSIGGELCRQIVANKPRELVLVELSEHGLYSIERELEELIIKSGLPVKLVPLLGSVQDGPRMKQIMSAFGVQTVYHAAAYKHVPIVEYNVVEGVRNNVFGTYSTVKAAVEAGVDNFVLVSTDKAVRPTNIMGASKRFAEMVLQAFSRQYPETRFCMVRFGNVLGSSGSVVPLFREQIRAGGPVTLTHKDVTRYFMLVSEAAQLVLQASAMSQGGDVFVLDMGEPVKIINLAERMIRLMGREVKNEVNPHGDVEIRLTGLRPGEKLYEELLIGDDVVGTGHPKIMCTREQSLAYDEMMDHLHSLSEACGEFSVEKIRGIFLESVQGFESGASCSDAISARSRSNADDTDDNNKVQPLFPNKVGEN
jgi:FlaA1/EpsC-like NDP-sugar epimerase